MQIITCDADFIGYKIYAEPLEVELKRKLPTDLPDDDEAYDKRAQAFILYLLASFLFADKSGDKIPLCYLIHLEDLESRGQLSWGSAVLGFSYNGLCNACQFGHNDVSSCNLLVQVWAWERIPRIQPIRNIVPPDPNMDSEAPLAHRWNCPLSYANVPKGCLPSIRDQLALIRNGDFLWLPYTPFLEKLPAFCKRGSHVWKMRSWIFFQSIREPHEPNRVLRQFDCWQTQPENPLISRNINVWRAIHKENKGTGNSGKGWKTVHDDVNPHWDNRMSNLVEGEEADTLNDIYHTVDKYRTKYPTRDRALNAMIEEDFEVIMENYNCGYGDAPYYSYNSEYGDYPTYQEDSYSWNNLAYDPYYGCDYQGYSCDAGYNSGFESPHMSLKMLSCLERIEKLLDGIDKKNASYFSQEDCYHSNASVYQPPPPQPTLKELAARQPTLRELAALQSSPCQPTLRQLGSSYQQPPAQPQLSVREGALRELQSEKGQQLTEEVNQYRLTTISKTDLECEELEETKEINSPDIPSSPDSSGIYIVVKHDSLILRVGDKNVDQVDFDENNIPIVSKEGFEVDTSGEVVPSIRDFEDDVKNGSMKDQEEDQWYKIKFEKEDVVVLECKFIFSHGKENYYKRFIVAAEHGFFWYQDGKFGGGVLADASEVRLILMREKGRAFNVDASPLRGEELAT
ncbi:OLC1v1001785C1 [Oldenlandia corymbosa var. corymbosa]|uniref:OLC1v1001785C1 n=1 Tax=Oldenlandia corymbosa var. corymbosa TaxID=529605 RepID=A0AAV1D8Z5_OLDCO|nr:OLC1v1001785C1 [Oldenlandia corymbosa var. corymbosa]